uniref:Calponin-homology (CH) domain-containing protein n=1 Tax=Macrostomum lignano TaxID=282301 RepID=A0A1I8H405_9PLAT
MQANTFLNWVNQNLSTAGKEPIDTLVTGFADGTKLVPLVEALQGRKLGRLNKPLTEHHRLENINMALQALAEDNVRLVNIGAEDIVKENVKLILGLVWHMILKYQIGKTSKIPSKKLMLYWVQAVIPSLNITNFTTDWNSGIALQ